MIVARNAWDQGQKQHRLGTGFDQHAFRFVAPALLEKMGWFHGQSA